MPANSMKKKDDSIPATESYSNNQLKRLKNFKESLDVMTRFIEATSAPRDQCVLRTKD